MTEEQKKERFTYCNCPRCRKHCEFYWEEVDDFAEWCEENCEGEMEPDEADFEGVILTLIGLLVLTVIAGILGIIL